MQPLQAPSLIENVSVKGELTKLEGVGENGSNALPYGAVGRDNHLVFLPAPALETSRAGHFHIHNGLRSRCECSSIIRTVWL